VSLSSVLKSGRISGTVLQTWNFTPSIQLLAFPVEVKSGSFNFVRRRQIWKEKRPNGVYNFPSAWKHEENVRRNGPFAGRIDYFDSALMEEASKLTFS